MSEQFEKEVLRMLKNQEKMLQNHDKDIKKVLKKVDNLEKGQQRLEERQERLEVGQQRLEERQQRLEVGQQRLEERQERLEERQEKLEAGQQRLEERQEKLEVGQQRLEAKQEKLEVRQKNFEMTQQEFNMRILELYENLKNEVSETKIELTKFSNHFTAFEFEINRKVDLLLETYDFDYKQVIKNNADVFDLQEKYSNHDCRITSLELRAAMP